MDLAAYRVCFRELEKLGSVAGTVARGAERLGDAVVHAGVDAGRTAAHTFNPAAWRSGGQMLSKAGRVEKLVMGGGMLADAATTGMRDTDDSGRHIGVGERAALVGSHVGAGLAGYHTGLVRGNALHGIAAGMGAMAITDRIARGVGRAGDSAVQAVAAPAARGVR